MTKKATDNLPQIPDIIITASAVNNEQKDFVFDKVLFDIEALASLQSIFDTTNSVESKTASVKFMITIQDEIDLQILGYSKDQIDKLKPQEAEDILKAGKMAKHRDACGTI